MGKIVNVGLLDTRKASKETLELITQISNVGLLIVSDDSQIRLGHCSKSNIGSTIKIEKEITTFE